MATTLGTAPDVPDTGPPRGSRHHEAESLRSRHVPVPERCRIARGPPGGLHCDRHRESSQEDEGTQRAPSDRVGCVWPSGGAVCDPDGDAPCGDDGKREEFFFSFCQRWCRGRVEVEKLNNKKHSLAVFLPLLLFLSLSLSLSFSLFIAPRILVSFPPKHSKKLKNLRRKTSTASANS